jgi:hypothetical protein
MSTKIRCRSHAPKDQSARYYLRAFASIFLIVPIHEIDFDRFQAKLLMRGESFVHLCIKVLKRHTVIIGAERQLKSAARRTVLVGFRSILSSL